MRVLWIGKEPSSGTAGDEIFDAKVVRTAIKFGYDIELFHPRRVSRALECANLMRGVPHPRTRYLSVTNVRQLQQRADNCDVIIGSWEPFDLISLRIRKPTILVLHNITSRSLPALFPNKGLPAILAERARRWEQHHYRKGPFLSGIGVLSRRDEAYLRGLKDVPEVLYLPPGMPPASGLSLDAKVLPELVILGTFDWKPKRRDIIRFAHDYAGARSSLLVRSDPLPEAARRLLEPLPPPADGDITSAMRFGVITDRFESGHKLKTLAYIAANNIVLTFSDVSFDFDHIPDHHVFIRRIYSIQELETVMQTFTCYPAAELRERFTRFKARCMEDFQWTTITERLMQAAERASGLGRVAGSEAVPESVGGS